MNGGARQSLVDGAHPMLTATGRLVLARDGVLWSAPFDRDTGRLTTEPVPVVRGVQQLSSIVQAAVASDTLVYAPGEAVNADEAALLSLVLVDGAGQEQRVALEDRPYAFPRLSPDGQLFEGDYVTGFDSGRHFHVAPDGRLLMLKAGATLERERSERAGDFVVVLDWQDELVRAPGGASGSR